MKRIEITLTFAAMICVLAWLDFYICLIFLLCIVIHELGHLAAMKLLKIPCGCIRIGIAGARIDARFPSYEKELLCALSGPLFGAIFALFFVHWMPKAAVISITLSLINLLPLYPLDGGRIVKAALCIYVAEDKAERMVCILSAVACCVLMGAACWAAVQWQTGLWPIFASLVLLCRVGRD